MTENDLSGIEFGDQPEASPQQLRLRSASTETIDLAGLLAEDALSSGTLDLSSVGATSFGRLLDALPIPAILIDQRHTVGFVNQSCGKISPDYLELRGIPFLDLVPRPADQERAQALAEKTVSLLERVFLTRKPQVAEAILEIRKTRVWARLHLRTVGIGFERYVLLLIEDMTHEKRQLELSRRQERESSKLHDDLQRRVQSINEELSRATAQLSLETDAHLRTQRHLRVEKQKLAIMWEQAPLAAALVAPTGTFHQINPCFTEMFGYDIGDVPSFKDWIAQAWSDTEFTPFTGADWLDALNTLSEQQTVSASAAVTCKGGTTRDVRFSWARLDDGHYFITCQAD
ncbi:MAG: PAS domain-containing protein [Thermodesulfobacteriota bacterium]